MTISLCSDTMQSFCMTAFHQTQTSDHRWNIYYFYLAFNPRDLYYRGQKIIITRSKEQQQVCAGSLGCNCHMPTVWILHNWVHRCCSRACRFLQRERICQHWKSVPLCTHRSRNLGPSEHVSLQTLCQSGKKNPQPQEMRRNKLFCCTEFRC